MCCHWFRLFQIANPMMICANVCLNWSTVLRIKKLNTLEHVCEKLRNILKRTLFFSFGALLSFETNQWLYSSAPPPSALEISSNSGFTRLYTAGFRGVLGRWCNLGPREMSRSPGGHPSTWRWTSGLYDMYQVIHLYRINR